MLPKSKEQALLGNQGQLYSPLQSHKERCKTVLDLGVHKVLGDLYSTADFYALQPALR